MLALLDCNNFFVSCERVFNPRLQGVPVAVMSNNDGCIIARSNEVKALGIPMGAPVFEYRDLMARAGVKLFSANFELYGDLSRRVFDIMRQMAPQVEVYSIDEAFMDLSGVPAPEQLAQDLRARVLDWVGLPVSLGVARTKTLCKVANSLAKQNAHHQGVLWLKTPVLETAALEATPIEEVWGVGRQLAPLLRRFGVGNARQLRDLDPQWLRRKTNVFGAQLVLELRGEVCHGVVTQHKPRQSIVCSRSFGEPVKTLANLQEAAAFHAHQAAYKLRQDGSRAGRISVFVKPRLGVPSRYTTQSLPTPTDYTPDLITAAQQLAAILFTPGERYKKLGVMLHELQHGTVQENLFAAAPSPRAQALMRTFDAAQRRWGKDSLRFAATGMARPWQSKRAARSPRYTTCWHELAKVS